MQKEAVTTPSQTRQPSQPVDPPSDVRDWEFSLPRGRGNVVKSDLTEIVKNPTFRWRLPELGWEWLCTRLAGNGQMIEALGETGRLIIRGRLVISAGVAYMYRDEDAPYAEPPEGEREDSQWRLCYFRAERNWRLRDQRMPFNDPKALRLVSGYAGDLNMTWYDGSTHIYHSGEVVVDKDNIAHFIDPNANA